MRRLPGLFEVVDTFSALPYDARVAFDDRNVPVAEGGDGPRGSDREEEEEKEEVRTRILGDVTRLLATRFERALRSEGEEGDVPVFVCHPLEALDAIGGEEGTRAAGVLYLFRIGPEPWSARREIRLEPAIVPGAPGHLAIEGAWIRLRYAFLVVGGTSTDELEILAAILADLHATPWVPVLDPRESRRDRERDDASPVPSPFEEGHEGAHEAWPLRTVEAPETWREIGLDEHRLAITFELSLGLPPPPAERLEPILERELDVAIEARAEAQRPDRGGLR